MKKVMKASGETQSFSTRKIYHTILEAGGSKKLALETVGVVRKNYCAGIDTNKILLMILKNLKKEVGVAQRYDLKRAVMNLGPSGFVFEEFFAGILNHYGYKTKVSNKIKGKIIYHEVDIVARKDKSFMIECKYHNKSGTKTRLQAAMYTYARFLDIGKFDLPWLATNTKCSKDATNYSLGVKMKITGWNYPKKESLQVLIERKNLYPITILKSIRNDVKENLFNAKIVVAKDLLNYSVDELRKKTNLSIKEIQIILQEVREVCKLNIK